MKIVVLGGGISSERMVSLSSSFYILEVLRSLGHQTIFVDSFIGINTISESIFDSPDGRIEDLEKSRSYTLEALKQRYKSQKGSSIGPNVIEICHQADFVFIGLHGNDGEDGKIQGLLDLIGVPYNGSDSSGSAMAMNKGIARVIMQNAGIRVPPLVNKAPCVIKPVHGGSSIGIRICDSDQELIHALDEAEDDDYIIERKIEGTEFTVGVLGDRALPPIELVVPEGRYLDYEVKYSSGERGVKEICPARICEEKTAELKELAVRIHKALKLSGYSRSDFIIDCEGTIWALEVNTLPGFTSKSAVPLAASHVGIDIGTLCSMLIDMGMDRSRNSRCQFMKEMAEE